MSPDPNLLSEKQRFEHLLGLVSSRRFLQREGLGNEVPFFICPFNPKDVEEARQLQKLLADNLRNKGVRVLAIDLYDLAIELLQARGIWEAVLETEPNISKAELKELLQGVLDPETHVVPAIARKLQEYECDVLFIGGVGEVYPYIRTHTILNNLQSKAEDKPVLLFFPGAYTQSAQTGASLNLFGKLHDDKYYRAFNVYDVEVSADASE
jgi:hypothetical protein